MNTLLPSLGRPALAIILACLVLPCHAQPANGGTPPAAATESTQATAPEAAGKPAAPTLADLGRSLRNYFTEEELSLLFQYMKETVMASFKGEEVILPPDLAFKLEILLVRLKREGGHYMDNLIMQLEQDLKNNLKKKLKETLTPPPCRNNPTTPG
jgi:hypothetical protein